MKPHRASSPRAADIDAATRPSEGVRLERPETLTVVVVRHIRDAIVRGEFPPGSPLQEIRLADQLNVSRSTIREALRELEDYGLVDLAPHRGAVVSQITPKAANEIYSVRIVLEGLAVRLAVSEGRYEGDTWSAIESAFSELERATRTRDLHGMIDAERDLHSRIWKACSHDLLKQYLENLQLQTRRLLLYSPIRTEDAVTELESHRILLKAIGSNRSAVAERAVREHIRVAGERVIARMIAGTGPRPREQTR